MARVGCSQDRYVPVIVPSERPWHCAGPFPASPGAAIWEPLTPFCSCPGTATAVVDFPHLGATDGGAPASLHPLLPLPGPVQLWATSRAQWLRMWSNWQGLLQPEVMAALWGQAEVLSPPQSHQGQVETSLIQAVEHLSPPLGGSPALCCQCPKQWGLAQSCPLSCSKQPLGLGLRQLRMGRSSGVGGEET